MRGEGRIYQRGNRWWIEYWVRGKQYREGAGETSTEAKRRLKKRWEEIHGDRFVGPEQERLTVGDLADSLITHLKLKGAKAVKSYEYHLAPIKLELGAIRAVDLTPPRVEHFAQLRLTDKKTPATVNREVGALRQAFRLAFKQSRLSRVPYFPMLRESDPRQGFFERAEFEAVLALLPEPVDEIARFAYLTGWRRGEVVSLRWDAVDRDAGEIRLATTKNGRPRSIPLVGELSELVKRRWTAREYQAAEGVTGISEYVFHRGGQPLVDFRRVWTSACTTAKVPGRLFHDLRRSAVRDMVRAGTPQAVAMTISGHRTASVFLRYNITSGEDQRQALLRVQKYRASRSKTRKVVILKTREAR